jgi:HNH endonuclease
MSAGRPVIPAEMKRRIMMEAGHRCAIPTCRTVPVELAHIDRWSEVREHSFENLIALCPTCHTRYDSGDIDRLSMKCYKANLGIISGRYGDMERRVLGFLAEDPETAEFGLPGAGWDIHLMYLIKDGLIEPAHRDTGVVFVGRAMQDLYTVTPAGQEFVKRYVAAEPVSSEAADDMPAVSD